MMRVYRRGGSYVEAGLCRYGSFLTDISAHSNKIGFRLLLSSLSGCQNSIITNTSFFLIASLGTAMKDESPNFRDFLK